MKFIRIIIAVVVALGAVISYYFKTSENPVTGEKQRVSMTAEQEIAMGLQAAPEMAAQHGGLHPDENIQRKVDSIGHSIVKATEASKSPYKFDFHVLADEQAVNAFALPGGQIFITMGLLKRLENVDQVAGVLGHEIAHVVGRHSAEHIAKAQLTQGLTGAAVIASYDPGNPSTMRTAAVAALIGQLINLKYGREDELESDSWGVKYLIQSGYKPDEMIGVMRVLEEASGGGGRQPEFMSTHPDPGNRVAQIQAAIREYKNLSPQAGEEPGGSF